MVLNKNLGWILESIRLLIIIKGSSLFRSHSIKEEWGVLVCDLVFEGDFVIVR